ncbi:RecQ helicase [Fusarium sp. MPI-SDFR-AT-0072]|nr:RecQ helicase [Fusarium sp. MPI-SDFR-AT-0072]
MCFVTSYHKSFRATGQAKVIHRYLPREVSELLQVQGIVKDAGIRSPYLWPDEVVRKVDISETEQRERRQAEMETGSGNGGRGDDDDDDNMDPNIKFESWVEERNWTRRLLGTMLNITRRYLNRAFKESTLDEDEDDDIEDSPQGLFSTATMRDKFRSREREPFETEQEHNQLQRFRRMQQVDIAGQLRRMLEAVIRAIMRGESPIVQITGTGGGKSMSFMLPAFCSHDSGGVTIVIVPLVSLRDDLHRRCAECQIETYVWDSRGGHQIAPIVFVTPESAVTKGFGEFVNRLQSRKVLDRVVVDECHAVLDSTSHFRPQLLELGRVLSGWGVQKIGEDEEAEDNHTVKIVHKWLDKNNHGRVIVYANTIDRVERLGRLLECSVYHSKVDTTLGKRQRLRSWIEQGHLIVATNALGLGVDVPDVRLVMHAGMPSRLRDYVQESGRAGRDGGQSEAVVVICQPEGEAGGQLSSSSVKEGGGRKAAVSSSKSNWPSREAAVERFISGKWCRRVVLDQVMDGQYDRAGCRSESEAECDVCVRQRDRAELEDDILWIEREGDMKVQGVVGGQQEREETIVEDIMEQFEKAQRNNRYEQFKARQEEVQENEEAKRFEEVLAFMVGRCIGCFMAVGKVKEDQIYTREEYPVRDKEWWRRVERSEVEWQEGMFKKGVMGKFSGCFWCGLPQVICVYWEALSDDQGSFKLRKDGECYVGYADREQEYDWQEAEDEVIYKVGFMKWLGETV